MSLPQKWGPHIDVELKPGTKRSLGEGEIFIPLVQDERTLFFGDIRARFDDSSNREGNFGLGLRRMLDGGWNIGGYGYFDSQHTESGSKFEQITLGLEALGRDWDARVNAYLPIGNTDHVIGTSGGGGTSAVLTGTTIQVTTPGAFTREERALQGYDAEIGWRVPFFDAEDHRQLRVYIGGFHFEDEVTNVSGPRVRAEFVIDQVPGMWNGAQLTIGLETQDDNVRGSQSFVSLRLRVPLGGGKKPRQELNAQERRMTAPIVRDVDIVTQARVTASTPTVVETASETTGGQAITVLSSSTTTGAALPGAVAGAGANSTVVLSGTFNTSGITALQPGQTLMGTGTLSVRTASGRTVNLITPGATITGAVAGNNPAVSLANNSTMTGLTVSNTATGGGTPNPFAVRANGVTGATVANNALSGTGNGGGGTAQALLITGASSNITVRGNTLTAVGTVGLTVGLNVVNSTGILVTGNTMSATSTNAPNSRAIVINNGSFAAGSTGNTIAAGICSVAAAGTGSIGLSSGGSCP